MSNLLSLDGYAAGPGGDVMALPFAPTFSEHNLELLRGAGTLVSGANTFRGFVSYWPEVAADPAQPAVEQAIARRHHEIEHLVVSDTLTREEPTRRVGPRPASLLPVRRPIDPPVTPVWRRAVTVAPPSTAGRRGRRRVRPER